MENGHALVIRDFPYDLKRRLKFQAYSIGVTLKEYVINALVEKVNADTRTNDRVPDVQRGKNLRAAAGRKPIATGTGDPGAVVDAVSPGDTKVGKVSLPTISSSVKDAADVCRHELCGHARKQHGHKYCSVVNCRCTGFEE